MPKPNKKKKKVTAKRENKKKQKSENVENTKQEIVNAEIDAVQNENNLRYIKLIYCIRRNKTIEEVNEAFDELLVMLYPKIQKLISRFNIPGYDTSDILQEALFALRYKAIKDYDKKRGHGEGPALFDKFALLCIRRHLATEFKSSYQNKKRVLNQSVSIDKETNSNNGNADADIYLSSIIQDPDQQDVLSDVADKEYYKNLNKILLSQLSDFEKEVYVLYAQKFSYEEIAEKINDRREKLYVNIKGVDNALSRIKHKAQIILQNYDIRNNEFE